MIQATVTTLALNLAKILMCCLSGGMLQYNLCVTIIAIQIEYFKSSDIWWIFLNTHQTKHL